MQTERPWYALHTRARHEKRVAETLSQRGFDVYLPLVSRVSQWHDRRKTVQWPLFPGYVFVRFEVGESSAVLSVPGSVQVIGTEGRPAAISNEEIDNVRRFAACLDETGVVPESMSIIHVGEPVVVQAGAFRGIRGRVLEHRTAGRVLIQIGVKAIGQALKVELDARALEADRTNAGLSA